MKSLRLTKQTQNKIFEKFSRISVKLFVVFALFLMPTFSLAASLDDINNQINNTNAKLNKTQGDRKTLQGEVNYFDGQIGGVQAQINSTDAEINKLKSEISTTEAGIKKAEADLAQAKDQLREYLRVMYEEGQISTLELIAESKNFSDFVDRSEYMQTMQAKIKGSADKIIILKKELETKKTELESKKKQTEELKQQQLAARGVLDSQRGAKNKLLLLTKGDEAEYQKTLKELKTQYAQAQAAISNSVGSGSVSIGSVNTGDVIGSVGTSGYSTGCHTHFEVWNTSRQHQNPSNYVGNGYFSSPLPGVAAYPVYGYSDGYFPGVFHTGVDYATGCGRAIKASAPGEIIYRRTGLGQTYPYFNSSTAYGNYVIIRHTNGMYTLYAHMLN